METGLSDLQTRMGFFGAAFCMLICCSLVLASLIDCLYSLTSVVDCAVYFSAPVELSS